MTETIRPASPDAIPEESPELQGIYRLLLDGSPDPIFAFAPDGRYLYVNRAFAQGVQRTVGQIVGKRIWDVFPRAEADQRYAALHQVFQSGMEKVIEVRVPRTDGDRYYVTTITPVKDHEDQVTTVICSSKEITERKRAELALRQSEEVNRAISSVTIDYSFIVDFTADGKSELRWASENLTEITGRSAAGIPTPETWQTIIHPD
ncbi:MAG TPA: PAS domain-containing protein, partial [Candidatus Aminicenantes bacterium]|nr:PAS domain-containing protein [Candidatus Aminicenantes bacterium]